MTSQNWTPPSGNTTHISVPLEAITEGPDMVWKHIDGPLLCWAGNIHWLTFGERLRLLFRLTTVDTIACAHWPHLANVRSQHVTSWSTP